ncbi:hypothetical protein BEN47_06170 [Hymenobacter lapidarius]|uniref:Tyr recombinase domain-containing protein n=1 Tax=Hymenobacter lapidarius TaxID=1908237 RepID=A0A1G1SQD6_9BACT|nr:site-specific integrase [Hymenobacter lapidarius]OGX80840.1 hypothetical protein BEN47_06170 [Hymenobacter lapidarius]
MGRDRIEVATGIETTYGDWDGAASRVLGRTPAARTANESLVKMRDRLTDIVADLDRQNKPITAKRVQRVYLTNGAMLNMIELFQQFLAEQQGLVGVEISPATATAHKVRFGNICAFLQAHKLTELRPEEFTINMADKLLYWLMKAKGHKRNTALKNLQNVSQVLTWGVRREHLDKNPMVLYQYKLTAPGEIKYLTVGEIGILRATCLPDYLARVRDCFLFQCWTGLAYADLYALNVARDAEYQTDAQGNLRRLLRVRRQKSTMHHGYECVIPLLPEAERLLSQYKGELPVPANAVYNRYLKEIGAVCGFSADKMTTHVGRKTAGVMMLNLGIRMEVVSKFLGHSSVKMTEKVYAKILDTTLVNEFDRVFSVTPLPTQPAAIEVFSPAPRKLMPGPGTQSFEMIAAW